MRRLLIVAAIASLTACAGGGTEELPVTEKPDTGFGNITPGWDTGTVVPEDSSIVDSGGSDTGSSGGDTEVVDSSTGGDSGAGGDGSTDSGSTGDTGALTDSGSPEAGGDSATCGKTGGACCPDLSCAGGALCVSGTCGTCGGPGLICCSGSACSTGYACSMGSCAKCGGLSQPCCGTSCDSGFVCGATGTCAKCGGIGEPCCGGGSCTSGVCAGGTCACGGVGQPCCAGSTCGTGATCSAGSCTACGAAGQPCCPGSVCGSGAVCSSGSCVSTTSCSHQADCTGSALKCGGPSSCAGTPCFTCYTPTGSGGPGASCTDSTGCASGTCDEIRSHCSSSCALGTTGDADCTTAMGTGYACTEETISIGSASATLGFCAKSCTRDGDCSGGDICQGTGNDSFNRLDIVCGPGGSGSARGATCTTSNDCASGVCLTSGTSKYCTAFCVSATDCGGTVPKCGSVSFVRPKGGTQSVKVCTP